MGEQPRDRRRSYIYSRWRNSPQHPSYVLDRSYAYHKYEVVGSLTRCHRREMRRSIAAKMKCSNTDVVVEEERRDLKKKQKKKGKREKNGKTDNPLALSIGTL